MAIGDIGHWRDSAGSQIPGTTYGAFNFASQQRNDNSTYSKPNDSTIQFEETGDFLIIGHIVGTDGSNGRFGPQAKLNLVTGSGEFFTSYQCGFNRNTNNNDWGVFIFGFYRNAAVNDEIQIQWRRDTDVATVGSTANASDIQIVKLADAATLDVGMYNSTTVNNAFGGTTPNDVSLQTTLVETDTAKIEIQAGDTDIRIKTDNTRYLILYTVGGDDGGQRTQRVSRLVSGSTEIDGSRSYFYQRNVSNRWAGLGTMVLHETATPDEDISFQVWRGDGVGADQGGADVDGSWTNNSGEETAFCVIELPSQVEVWKGFDGTGLQTVSGGITATMDIMRSELVADTASFGQVGINGIDCVQTSDVLTWANIWTARNNVGSGSRFTAGARIELAGADQTLGVDKTYNRGNQGTQDNFGATWHPGAIFGVNAGDDIQFEIFDDGDNGATDRTQPTSRGNSGCYAINLDTLVAAGGGGGRIMSSLAHHGGLSGPGGIAGQGGGLSG